MEENYSSIFVRNIIQIAKHNNISIGKLEKKIGVSTGYLSRVCGGIKSIGLDKTLAICKCLNMSIYDILNYDCTHAEIEDIDKQIDELKSKRDSLIDNIKTPDIANIEIDKILPAIPTKIVNTLKRNSIYTLNDLLKEGVSWKDLVCIRNFGKVNTARFVATLIYTFGINMADETTTDEGFSNINSYLEELRKSCYGCQKWDLSAYYRQQLIRKRRNNHGSSV